MKWQNIRWKAIEKYVFSMQKKIYQASLDDKNMEVIRLQKILVRSKAAKLKAIRKVTQDNIGKRTPGVDGIESIPPEQRLNLLPDLNLDGTAAPIKRVYIPKGKNEKRPLGIPIIQDRIKQALVKLVLEPEWEAKFEPNSYGFRPGRSSHDAVEAIFIAINQKPKYVLDADIKGCFDNIDHQFLLTKLNTFPEMQMQIKSWLKAGVMKDISLTTSKKGVSQGGTISPLLMNIALHGLETEVIDFMRNLKLIDENKRSLIKRRRPSSINTLV
jgi:RNA-directed DNA polymerase